MLIKLIELKMYVWLIELIVLNKLIELEVRGSQIFLLYHLLPNQLLNLINQSTLVS